MQCPPCPDAEAQWSAANLVIAIAAVVVVGAFVRYRDGAAKKVQVGPELQDVAGIIQEMLMTMCDGYLVLSRDGSIVSMDPGAEAIVGNPAANKKAFRHQIAGDGQLKPGQRRIRISKTHLEVYTLQTGMSPAIIRMVVGDPAVNDGENLYMCCLRSHDEGGDRDRGASSSSKPANTVSTAVPQKLLARAARSTAVQTSSSFLLEPRASDEQGPRIMHPESACDSSLISATRTQLDSGAAQNPLCLPNTWESIQAVGLGVHSYEKLRPVGGGGQGKVWQVKDPDCEDGFLAQKEISLKGQLWHRDFPKRLRDADREIRALKKLSWARRVVVPIVDCWIQTNFEYVYIVMEWLPCTLGAVIQENRAAAKPFRDQDVCWWLAQLVCGLAAIHEAGLIHRDIKPSNILLDEERRSCKIADLGVSRTTGSAREDDGGGVQQVVGGARREREQLFEAGERMDDSKSQLSSVINASSVISAKAESMLSSYTARPGTSDYMSPEALRGGNYGTPMDVFGLGGVLLEMLTLRVLPAVTVGEVDSNLPDLCVEWLTNDGSGAAQPRVTDDRRDLRLLCTAMLNATPESRPSAKELLGKSVLKDHIHGVLRDHAALRERLLFRPAAGGRPRNSLEPPSLRARGRT